MNPGKEFTPSPDKLYVVPLGGLGEIGKNMMAILYGSDMVIVDAGVMFPKEEMPGVDFVIPDIQFVLDHKEKVKGIFLTHGHEDHIGALPYILPRLDAPVYGTKLTLGLVRGKLREFSLDAKTTFVEIRPGSEVSLGKMKAEFFPNVHSINDGVGVVLRTPAGTIVHSGDFKFDQTPPDGMATDFKKLSSLGHEGVTLLLSDSTYAERPGYSLSEKIVGRTFRQLFPRIKGRILIATFASSIPRIQQIVDVAAEHGRKICFLGRSMVENARIAGDLGFLHIPDGMIVSEEEISRIPGHQLVILTTGSQGEPFSALSLMAAQSHKSVDIVKGDTVVISATPIPGNEGLVYGTINKLYRLGAEVIYSLSTKQTDGPESFRVHVQGHAGQEELKLFMNLLKPKYFVPIHGEYRHLIHHGQLAQDVGIPAENVLIAVDGDVIEVGRDEIRVVSRLTMDRVYVDGRTTSGMAKHVVKERRALAEDGVLVLSVILEKETGKLLSGPEFASKGFVSENGRSEVLAEAGELVKLFFEGIEGKTRGDAENIKGNLKGELNKLFGERMGRKPIIIPVISWL